jgi:hypothetical protein
MIGRIGRMGRTGEDYGAGRGEEQRSERQQVAGVASEGVGWLLVCPQPISTRPRMRHCRPQSPRPAPRPVFSARHRGG